MFWFVFGTVCAAQIARQRTYPELISFISCGVLHAGILPGPVDLQVSQPP